MGTIQASVFVDPSTLIEAWDQPYDDGHIAGLRWNGLTLHFRGGVVGSDAGIVEACDRLIDAVGCVRAAARRRMEEAEREAELERRDERIDAGLPTGYIGDPA